MGTKRPRSAEEAAARSENPLPVYSPPRVIFSYDAELLERVISKQLLPEACVGLDIEWRPFHAPGAQENRVALIQISSSKVCVLVPVRYVSIEALPSLQRLLRQESTWKVGCGIEGDAQKLRNDLGVECSPVLELGSAACMNLRYFPEMPRDESVRPGLKRMAGRLGMNLSKPKSVARSDWERRPLTPEQQRYASQDAYVGLWLALCLHQMSHQMAAGAAHGSGACAQVPEMWQWLSAQAALLEQARGEAAMVAKKRRVEQEDIQTLRHACQEVQLES